MANPTTVDEYLEGLPDDRRKALTQLRDTIRANLDSGYEEGIQYRMIGYYVPHRVFPPGYHCDPKEPLPYVGLASQKGHMSLYMMALYLDEKLDANFREAWKKTGKKLDMGKSCLRFKTLEDLALDVIAQAIRATPAKQYIAHYQTILATRSKMAQTGKAKPAPRAQEKGRARAKAVAKARPAAKAKPAAKASEKPRARR